MMFSSVFVALLANTAPVWSFRISRKVAAQLSRDTLDAPGEISFQVYSDVDDTMLCSRAAPLHGLDTNCDKKGAIYPGVVQFAAELGVGTKESAGASPGRLIPLSARPHELKSLLQMKKGTDLYDQFEAIGTKMGLKEWGLDVEHALYGSVWSSGSWSQIAATKYHGWVKRNDPKPGVFIGDNGQGDVIAASYMMRHDSTTSGPKLVGAFIHHVQSWPWLKGRKDLFEKSGLPMPPDVPEDAQDLIRYLPVFDTTEEDKLLSETEPGEYLVVAKDGVDYRRSMEYDDKETEFQGPGEGDVIHGEPVPDHPGWLKVGVTPEMYLSIQQPEAASATQITEPESDQTVHGVFLFREYAHAACIAFKQSFISEQGYNRVLESIAAECAGSGEKACAIMKPHFEINGESWKPRPAARCNWPWTAPAKEISTLAPKHLFAQEGHWMIGFCKQLNAEKLNGLKMAQDRIKTHSCPTGDTDTPGERKCTYAGLPPALYWAARDGVNCLDDGPNKKCYINSKRINKLLRETGWTLKKVANREKSPWCQLIPPSS